MAHHDQQQLPLVGGTEVLPARPSADDDWRLDEATRRAGRLGVAAARDALARSAANGTARAA